MEVDDGEKVITTCLFTLCLVVAANLIYTSQAYAKDVWVYTYKNGTQWWIMDQTIIWNGSYDVTCRVKIIFAFGAGRVDNIHYTYHDGAWWNGSSQIGEYPGEVAALNVLLQYR